MSALHLDYGVAFSSGFRLLVGLSRAIRDRILDHAPCVWAGSKGWTEACFSAGSNGQTVFDAIGQRQPGSLDDVG